MRKLVFFMHTSLDGFVATTKGEIDWAMLDDELFDYVGVQTDKSDTALYARVTYQLMEDYWPTAADKPDASKHDKQHSAWYKKVEKIIISRTLQQTDFKDRKVISENIPEEISKLKQKEGKDIVIFGSPSLGKLLMKENLIDDYCFFVNPIILGKGLPLFTDVTNQINLKMVESKVYANGVVGLHYEKR